MVVILVGIVVEYVVFGNYVLGVGGVVSFDLVVVVDIVMSMEFYFGFGDSFVVSFGFL